MIPIRAAVAASALGFILCRSRPKPDGLAFARAHACLSTSPLPLPAGYFLTKIFHPNVSDKGDICVNTLKKDWTPDTTLAHVLAVIRCLLIVPFPESSLNDEAGKLFMESYDDYSRKARLVTNVHAMRGAGSSASAAAAGGAGSAAAAGAGAEEPSAATEVEVAGPVTSTSGAEPLSAGSKGNVPAPAPLAAGVKAAPAAGAGAAAGAKAAAAAADKKKSMKRL